MERPEIERIAPFLIVADVDRSLAFYAGVLGFEVWHRVPEAAPFFAIVGRGDAMLMVKSGTVEPLPNAARHPDMRWDAYVSVPDPDALAAEFATRGAQFSATLADTHDGLRGFEIRDPDGHALFFGRPRAA